MKVEKHIAWQNLVEIVVRPLVQKDDNKYYKTTDLCQAVCIASGFGYSSNVWISSDRVTLSKNPEKEQNFVVKVYVEQATMCKKPHFCTSLSRFPFRKERQNDQYKQRLQTDIYGNGFHFGK